MQDEEKIPGCITGLGHRLAAFSMQKVFLAGCLLMAGLAALPVVTAEELSRQQIYDNFAAAYQAGDLATARDWGVRLVEAKQAELGADSPQLIISLLNLASVNLQLMDWDAARFNASQALAILDAQPVDAQPIDAQPGDTFAKRMEFLTILAKAQLGLREEGDARDTITAAFLINNKQIPVDKWHEAELHALLFEIARREQHERSGNQAAANSLKARTEYYGETSIDLVPYIEEVADWYRASSQLGRERKMHQRSIEILEQHYGPSDAHLVNPLREIAATYLISHKSPGKALATLERAAALTYPETAEAELLQALVQADLGDYHVVFGKPEDGTVAYRQSWRQMDANDELGPEYANRYFAEVRQLYYNQPDNPASSTKGADFFTEGYVLTEFTVSADGTLTDIRVVESKPVQMKERLFVKALQKARFRPRLIDGEPVATKNVPLRNSYGYVRR